MDTENFNNINGQKGSPKSNMNQENSNTISKAKEILNWEPKISRKEGLQLTLDYFVSLRKTFSNQKIVD